MQKDINKILIESSIRKVLNNKKNSHRDVRNLIDLGIEFSRGRFQKYFLQTFQNIIENDQNQYFSLIQDTLDHVNHDRLMNFGMNIGYESCTKGAKTIRKIESQDHYNIPWSLILEIDAYQQFYQRLIYQAKALGIHTFMLFIKNDPELILPMIKEHPDCAFIIFLHKQQIHYDFIKSIKTSFNIMIAICYEQGIDDLCLTLRNEKMLYSLYYRYTSNNITYIQQKQTLSKIKQLHPLFLLLLPHLQLITQQEQFNFYHDIINSRKHQTNPTIFLDIKYDNLFIDTVISQDGHVVAFDAKGYLHTHIHDYHEPSSNIFSQPLAHIFQTYLPKQ